MTQFSMMSVLLVELIWLLSSMSVLADMNDYKAVPWPDGGNSDFTSKDSIQIERSKRNAGSKLYLVLLYIYLSFKSKNVFSLNTKFFGDFVFTC